MKNLVRSTVLGLCMAAPMISGAATVTNTNLGLVSGSSSFSQTHTAADNAFTDTYNFTVNPNAGVGAAVITFKLSSTAAYTNFTSGLLDGAAPLSVVIDNAGAVPGANTIYATFGVLASGVTHSLVLAGQTFGVGQSTYSGNWQVVDAVTATPIPAAVWLFGSALAGLMGVSGRKKTLS